MRDFAELVLMTLGIPALLVAGIGTGVRYAAHHSDSVECPAFAEATGRETRFVDYSWWSWECLTPTTDGKWLPVDQLREEVGR